MTDLFARQLRIDQIRDGERLELSASADERQAIARRLGLQSLDRLGAHVTLSRAGSTIRADGRLTASLDQSCVVTGDPVAAHVDEPFSIQFACHAAQPSLLNLLASQNICDSPPALSPASA